MKHRRLGNTALEVSVVGIGTWQFGGEWGPPPSQPTVDRILGRARELGINFIDTAECYGDHLSESMIGNAVAHARDAWIIATKFGHRFLGNYSRQQMWSPEQVRTQLEDSLRALKTDHIDVYQFHSGTDAEFDNHELWAMLAEQVRAGKIRHLGVSIGSYETHADQVARASAVGAEVIQVVYNRLERGAEERIFPVCQERGLGVLARVPLASGYLSGKYRPGSHFSDAGDVRSLHDRDTVQARLTQVQEIQSREVPPGVPMSTWALVWCLRHPAVTCVIPGCKDADQVADNARAADLLAEPHPQSAD